MTVSEARNIQDEFNENQNPTDEDVFMFTEAMNFLIEEEHNPSDMLNLGGYYYELIDFDPDDFDLYDLYYLLKSPHKITFMYNDEPQKLESVMEGDECTVCFNGKWYHSRDDFFKDACVDDVKITEIYDEFWGFNVE